MNFQRKVGALADMKELEYVIALHQTCMPDTRENATISSIDVALLLKSRYRLQISHRQAIYLVNSLGGGDNTMKRNKRRPDKKTIFPFFGKKKTSSFLEKSKSSSVEDETAAHTLKNNDDSKHPPDTWEDASEAVSRDEHRVTALGVSVQSETTEEDDELAGLKDRDLPEKYLDMVQIMSVLFIPAFARSGQEFWNPTHPIPPPPGPTGNSCKVFFARRMERLKVWALARIYPPPQHEALFSDQVRNMMRQEFPSKNIVDEVFVEELLLRYGEVERAQNPRLIREMVEAARSASGTFDDESFINAISSDLGDWDLAGSERMSSFFFDVFGTEDPSSVERLEVEKLSESVPVDEEAHTPTEPHHARCCDLLLCCCHLCCRSKPGPFKTGHLNADLVIDTQGSLFAVVAIWAFFIATIGTYAPLILSSLTVESECETSDKFWCQLIETVINWMMIGIILSIFGVSIIIPLSYGNSPYGSSYAHSLFSVFLALAYSIIPYVVVELYVADGSKPSNTTTSDIVTGNFYKKFQRFTMMLGITVAALLGFKLLTHVCHGRISWRPSRSRGWMNILLSSSNLRGEIKSKSAVGQKVNTMFQNAWDLHQADQMAAIDASPRKGSIRSSGMSSVHSSSEKVMRNFVLLGERNERCGGLFWTWWRILNGSLFSTEGIWINTRLITIQVAQVVTAVLVSLLLLVSVESIANEAEEARQELDPSTPQWVVDLVPTAQMVYRTLYPATFVAILVIVMLIFLYIPSAVATVLKYRCQIRPSLGSPYFYKYRTSVDTAYMNTANAIYGMIGSAGLFYLLIGLVLFLCQWPFSQPFMIKIIAWSIGLGITCTLKYLLTLSCRAAQYRSFYRVRPSAASLSSLALECWYIGLGGSVLLGRVTQFLFAAAFWVGRIDVPFLDEDISLFGYSFDYVPTYFIKDLLVHEAHRHPYIERLAQMYLMKLRFRDSFGSNAGAAWRQLTILAMFPWVAKNRVFDKERLELTVSELEKRMRAAEEENGGLEGAVAGLAGLTAAIPNLGAISLDGADPLVGGIRSNGAATQGASFTERPPFIRDLSADDLAYMSADEHEVEEID